MNCSTSERVRATTGKLRPAARVSYAAHGPSQPSAKLRPMASKSEPHPPYPGKGSSKPLDRDEKVKLDLPFGTALRALLKTPPPETRTPKGK